MNKKLQELTDETIREIRKLEIVLPEIYKDIFFTKANELDITIDEDDREKAMIYALKKIQKMRDETENSASSLKTNIQKARVAIIDGNEKDLKSIEDDVIALEKKIVHLQEDLYLDELTNIYNRRWLYEKFLNSETFLDNGAFAFIDIDDFKNINDSFGHLVGDKILAMIGSLLRKVENSFAIRFAGDEFILLSKKHNQKELIKLLKNIRRNLYATNLKHENQTFNISFSFGVTNFEKGEKFKEIFKKSDDLMYFHKRKTK